MEVQAENKLFAQSSTGFGAEYDKQYRKNHTFQHICIESAQQTPKPVQIESLSDREFIRAMSRLCFASVCIYSLFKIDHFPF